MGRTEIYLCTINFCLFFFFQSEEIFENLCLAGEGELDKWLKMNFGHKINKAFGSFEEFTKSINRYGQIGQHPNIVLIAFS